MHKSKVQIMVVFMELPQVHDEYICSGIESDQDIKDEVQLCFRVQEILSAYSMYDYQLSVEEETPEDFKPLPHRKSSVYDGEFDYDAELEDFVSHEKTAFFEIGDGISAIIDNIPFIVDENKKVQQLIQPGYVALKIFDSLDYDELFNKRCIDNLDQATTQLIFRLPWHDEGSAIFLGFSMDDNYRVEINEQNEESIHTFLEDIVDILRFDLRNDAHRCLENYSVQNKPAHSIYAGALKFLQFES